MKRHLRVLLAWFDRHEAVSAQLGFRVPEAAEDVSTLRSIHDGFRAARLARAPFDTPLRPLGTLPDEIAAHGASCCAAVTAAMDAAAAECFSPAVVDLSQVLSLQKAIAVDDIDTRVGRLAADDWTGLAALCLPIGDPVDDLLHGTFDKDGRGVTIASLNPNMRVTGVQNVLVPGSGARVVGFQIIFGTPHLHVVEYKGRRVLKDGYHRAYGLMSRGITRVPCVFERAGSFADVHSGASSLISPEDLLGPHPPLIADFFDPMMSMTVEQQNFRKVIRIRAEEFAVSV
jgi:hypothetical protein